MATDNTKCRLLHVVGNRPQFIKLAALLRALPDKDFSSRIVHSGQHYDYEMSKIFFKELGIPKPNYFLSAGTGTHGVQTAKVLARLDPIWKRERPDVVVVYGDTNTTLAAALGAYKFRISVAHVEAGLREFAWRPEEVNKKFTDHCSDYCFCPTKRAVENLRAEGVAKRRIFLTGDITYDSFLWTADRTQNLTSIKTPRENFLLLTLHRAETVDCPQSLASIVKCLIRLDRVVYFPVHPRTRLRLREFGLWGTIARNKNFHILPPLGYFEFIAHLVKCSAVLTDSGGVIKEGFYARKPTVILDRTTEYSELLEEGTTVLAGHNGRAIERTLKQLGDTGTAGRADFFGDGKAGEKMARILRCSPRR